MTFTIDHQRLDDLVEFARIEVQSRDVEPWAAILHDLHTHGVLGYEEALWVLSLYNTYDSLGSAWQVYRRWPGPLEWAGAPDGDEARRYPIMQERRNLHGGRVNQRLASYAGHLSGAQDPWLRVPLVGDSPEADYRRLMTHLRQVWGVGRQAAFEWAEFLQKVTGYPVHAPDAELWESSGPRRSLQRIYGNPNPDQAWLDDAANHARGYLAANGVDVPWEDFETLICDFNVMRDGRYYPGRHLAALREEIETLPDVDDRNVLMAAWGRIVPPEWADIPPGINKTLMPVYRDTGLIRSHA